MSNETVAPTDKWAKKAMTPTVEAFHSRIRAIATQRLRASGKTGSSGYGVRVRV